MRKLTALEQLFLDGMVICIPDSNTKTLKQILREPLDVLYVTRPQVERWSEEVLEKNSNLPEAKRELEKRKQVEREEDNGKTIE